MDVAAGTVHQASSGLPATRADGPNLALFGEHEVSATIAHVRRTPVSGTRTRIAFDLSLTNRFANADLLPATFPAPPLAEVVAFPFRTDPAGLFGLRVIASSDWDGAPWNFFNDPVCVPLTPPGDCFRWEGFGATVPAGSTTAPRTVGFNVDASISSFTVYVAVASDLRERPGQPVISLSSFAANLRCARWRR